MILSGCSTNNPVKIETVYEKIYIPSELLEVDCDEKKSGETVRSLANAYVVTRACLRAHKVLNEGLKRNYTLEGTSDGR